MTTTNPLIEKLLSNPEPWHNDDVSCSQDFPFSFYLTSKPSDPFDKEIDTKQIVGTFHETYTRHRWKFVLLYLKRNNEKLLQEYETALAHINNEKITDKKRVYKFGDKYFIVAGNHRLTFAKFMNLNSVLCEVVEYLFDNELFNIDERLKDLQKKYHFEYRFKSRALHLTFKDKKISFTDGLSAVNLINKMYSIKFSSLESFFYDQIGENKISFNVHNDDMTSLIDNLILRNYLYHNRVEK